MPDRRVGSSGPEGRVPDIGCAADPLPCAGTAGRRAKLPVTRVRAGEQGR
ncbi:hypothetical protein [Micromonospora sp. NBC_01813]|nr:hypothetical protein [Micromonospora sp. NBC_01813]WSA08867.1 hypothetical protein OG958_32700 [Micromonospora sp. NBC_01813]